LCHDVETGIALEIDPALLITTTVEWLRGEL
jgi:hypothetical protein